MRRGHRSGSIRAARREDRHRHRAFVYRAGGAEFALEKLTAQLVVADGEALPFGDGSFDLVYAHGVVQYTTDDRALVRECRRVLRPGGMAVFQVYNRISWLNALSQVTKVDLEHVDAPVLKKYSIGEFRDLLKDFSRSGSCPNAFP